MSSEKRETCPPEQVWDEVAVGVAFTGGYEDQEALLNHARRCEDCARKLRASLDVFGETKAAGEDNWVRRATAQSAAVPPDASERASPIDISAPGRTPRTSSSTRRYWLAAAAAVLVAILSFTWRTMYPPSDAEGALATLAAAYAERRPSDTRLPGAAYGPVRGERGAGELPAAALEAAALIQRRREAGDLSAEWTRAEGRLALLRGRGGEAVERFEEALDLGGDDADLLAELAVAYVARGDETGSPADYTAAVETVGRALEITPVHPAALFNRAVALERLGLDSEAVRAWDDFLSVARDDDWAAEARTRRAAAGERLGHLLSPQRALRSEQLVEERLERVLLAAGNLARSGPTEEERATAEVLTERHGDPWLGQILSIEGWTAELNSLAEATRLRRTVSAHAYGDLPQRWAAASGPRAPPALRAWAAFENLYYLSHTTPSNCGDAPEEAQLAAQRGGYRWLLAQTLLETSTCRVSEGKQAAAELVREEATAVATAAGYPVALIRSRGFQASHWVNQGRYREALQVVAESIREIQQRELPLLRLLQFFSEIRRSSERLQRLHAALAGAVTAADLCAAVGCDAQNMIQRSMAADYASQLALHDQAAELYRQAAAVERRIRPLAKGSVYETFAALSLAEGRRDLNALDRLQSDVEAARNAFWLIPHRLKAAELKMQQGRTTSAEADLDRAIEWLSEPQRARAGAAELRWRRALEQAYEFKTRIALGQGRFHEAYGLWREYRRQDAALLGFEPSPAEALADAPAPGTLRLTFVRLGPRYAAWSETSQEVRFGWAPAPADEIDRRSRMLRRLCARSETTPAAVEAPASELAAALLEPFAEELHAAGRVELDLSGDVSAAPLHVLPLGDRGPLGLIKPVVYRLSPRQWPGEPASRGSALVVAASALAPNRRKDYPYLPGLVREARAVARRFPDARVLVDDEARAGAVERAFAGQTLFHYAGHSFYRGDRARLSLSPTSRGDELDVTALRGRAPWLAFLAACSTGDSVEPDTVAPRNVAQAFLREGSRMTVAAMWNLDSATTSETAERFYDAWLSGRDPAEALAEAVRAVALSGRERPYYWAPFVVSY